MSIILVSAWPYAQGREIAQGVAKRLGYCALGPELLERVAQEGKAPPDRLAIALGREAPLLGIGPKERPRLLAHLEAAVLAGLGPDKAVCWGLGAHLYLSGISHVLKVRLLKPWDERVAAKAQQEGLSRSAAEKGLRRQDEACARLAEEAYRKRESDPDIFDLTINLAQIGQDQAIRLIADTAGHKRFQPMTFSRRLLADKALAAAVRAALVDSLPEAQVNARSGLVKVRVQAVRRDQEKKLALARQLAAAQQGVAALEVEIIPDYFQAAAESMR